MKVQVIFYWTFTTMIALETFVGGVMDLTHGRTVVYSGPRVADGISNETPNRKRDNRVV